MSNLVYWLWYSSLRALRPRTGQALLERCGGVKELYFAPLEELLEMTELREEERSALKQRSLASAEQTAARCEELRVSVVTMQDAAFPERLRNIPDPPAVLYVKGKLPVVDAEAVIAVVGTRGSTEYGNKMARTLGFQIAQGGGIVCTGLAAGVDSRAAEGALMAGGKVIGVLGVAINAVYPRYNGPLPAPLSASIRRTRREAPPGFRCATGSLPDSPSERWLQKLRTGPERSLPPSGRWTTGETFSPFPEMPTQTPAGAATG